MRILLFILLLISGQLQAQIHVKVLHHHQRFADPAIPDTIYSSTVGQFNCRGTGGTAVAGWTDFTPVGDPHLAVLSGTSNGYTASTNATGAWNGLPATSGTAGETTSDGGGFYQGNSTLNSSYFFNQNNAYSGATSDANFRISGLTEDSIYAIDIVPSRNNSGGVTAKTMKVILHDKDGQHAAVTTFWNTGTTLNAFQNTSKYVRLFAKADASGFVYFYIGGSTDNSTSATAGFGYANSISVRKVTIIP